jgi:hypothetical protein
VAEQERVAGRRALGAAQPLERRPLLPRHVDARQLAEHDRLVARFCQQRQQRLARGVDPAALAHRLGLEQALRLWAVERPDRVLAEGHRPRRGLDQIGHCPHRGRSGAGLGDRRRRAACGAQDGRRQRSDRGCCRPHRGLRFRDLR